VKLAEALALRADQKKRLAASTDRLLRSARVQEGDRPPEDPTQLRREFEELAADHERMIARINRTNLAVLLPDGRTLTDALARRDVLLLKITAYRRVLAEAATPPLRLTRSEIKSVATIDVAELQREIDRLSKIHRELDTAIQSVNWMSDLVD
jgi:hypothetical protein